MHQKRKKKTGYPITLSEVLAKTEVPDVHISTQNSEELMPYSPVLSNIFLILCIICGMQIPTILTEYFPSFAVKTLYTFPFMRILLVVVASVLKF